MKFFNRSVLCGERVRADERILGSGPFVEQLLARRDDRPKRQAARAKRLHEAEGIILQACQRNGISDEELRMGGRRRQISAVRAHLAVRLVTQGGLSLADAACQLGVSTSGIAKAVARAEAQ